MIQFPVVESEVPNEPQALRPPYFPSSTTLVDPRHYAGGIPIRALEGNLQCIIPPWAVMGVGDQVDVFWQSLTSPAASKTIEFDHEVDQQVVRWIPRAHVLDGDAMPVFYRVTRRNQTPEPSAPLQTYLVKTTRPGGYDDSPEEGHSGFQYTLVPDVSGGVDPAMADAGIEMRIQPYEHMTRDDRVVARWGSQEVSNHLVTQAQVDDPVNNPIIITFTRAVIEAAGDGDRVVVTFQVIDCVDNRPDERAPWAKLSYVLVDLGGNRLDAPLVLMAGRPTNSIDLDQLGDDHVNVRVYTNATDFAVGDTVRLTWTGTPAQGSPIIVGPLVELVDFVPFQLDFTIPNAAVKAIAQGYATVSYVRIRGGEANRPSKNASVSVQGDISRLPAPSVAQAPGGTLPADVPYATISVAYFEGRKTGDLITIHCQGRRPGGSETYYPIHIIVADSDGRSAITRDLPSSEIAPLGGGTLKLYYVVANDDLAVRSERESLPLNLNVGVALPDFNQPEITEADGDVLLPENTPNGANVIAPFNVPGDTLPGDTVGLRWTGSFTGAHPLYEIPLTTQTAGKPVPFLVRAEHIHPNVNGTVEVDYYRKRGTEATRFSRKRVLSVGNALPDWAAPTIKEAPNGVSLNPVAAKDTLTAIVDYDMRVGDKITVTWTGASGVGTGGSHTTAAFNVENLAPKEIPLPNSVVAYNLNKPVVVTYSVTRGSTPAKPSLPLTLNVLTIPASDLDPPRILEAQNNGDGPELNISNLTAGATLKHGSWPLLALRQRIWSTCKGRKANGDAHDRVIMYGEYNQLHQDWINKGYYSQLVPYDYLKELADGSLLNLEFKVGMDKSPDPNTALSFPVRTYTIKAIELVNPVIDSVTGASSGAEIPDNGTTTETSVILRGKASKNLTVQLYNGVTPIGLVITVADSGEWNTTLPGLSANTTYNIKARALYGAQPESAARAFTVRAVVSPTITSVKGSPSNVEIPNNGTTVETSVTLSGKASGGMTVQLYNGTTAIGSVITVAATGDWTMPLPGLSANITYNIKARALYGAQPESAARAFTVRAVVNPTITSVKGSPSNVEIPPGGTTVETSAILTGKATAGLTVQLYNGTTAIGPVITVVTNGDWTTTLTGLSANTTYNIKARALYGAQPESGVWVVNVTALVTPSIRSVETASGQVIPNDGTTDQVNVTLFGTASVGQRIELYDNNSPKEIATATNGNWSLHQNGMTPGSHNFTAKALYGSGVTSAARTLKVLAVTSGIERFPATIVFELFNTGDKFESTSGLEFTLLTPNPYSYPGASANRTGYSGFLALTSAVQLNFKNGVTRTIEFEYTHNLMGAGMKPGVVTFYGVDDNLIATINFINPDFNYHQFTYTPPAGVYISYFKIVKPELSGFISGLSIKNISWSGTAS